MWVRFIKLFDMFGLRDLTYHDNNAVGTFKNKCLVRNAAESCELTGKGKQEVLLVGWDLI